ncbi:hypothetical protein SK128_004326 [Halocaridina rubra]
MKVLILTSLVVLAGASPSQFVRVPDFEPVQDLFTAKVVPGPSLSTSPGFDAALLESAAIMPGLRSGLQAAVGSSQLGVVSNVAPELRALTFDIGTCYYWCRTNEGQPYCCESDTQNPHVPLIKTGKCPATCPAQEDKPCRLDSDCQVGDKCCINPCSPQERVCRAPAPL